MKKILLIDDSITILQALKSEIISIVDNIEILSASSYKEVSDIIRHNQNEILVAVVDLDLPDCEFAKAALLTNAHKIPSIILTSSNNKDIQSLLLKKDILDYINKSSSDSIKYAANFVKKIVRNSNVTALVVDDSKFSRNIFKKDLEKLRINVFEAKDGQEALDIMESNEDISLILTDYNMPRMNGIELTSRLRRQCNKDTLAIIALSATDDERILSDFIKAGANDFLAKPHRFEELNARVQSNLDLLDLFKKIQDLANKDFLTGSYNRRYFFEASKAIVEKNVRKERNIVLATLDIDHFKRVNDTYGHDIGDIAIQEITTILDANLRTSDLVARFGGEEFCILLEDISIENTKILFEKIRLNFEKNEIKLKRGVLKYTVSLGVSYGRSNDINKMIKVSDEALFEAKESGRNKVVIFEL